MTSGGMSNDLAEALATYGAELRRFGAAAVTSMQPWALRAVRAMRHFTFQLQLAEFRAIGRTRPDGRPRRSGHRHRGTPAWRRRHG